MSVIHLKANQVDDFINSKPVVLIHFWATWNRYDDVVAKTLLELAPLYAESVAIGAAEIDLEEFWPLASALGIKRIPAIAFYKQGKLTIAGSESFCLEAWAGILPREEIEAKIKDLLRMPV